MAWVRTDDQFWYHEKVVDLSDGACLLFLIALAHSNAHLTDGRITPTHLHICAAVRHLPEPESLAAELVAAGLWERTRRSWRIHDYTDYQPTADQIRQRRADTARRTAEWRARRRPQPDPDPEDYGECDAVSDASVTLNPYPDPYPYPGPYPSPPTHENAHARAHEPTDLLAFPKPGQVERAQLEARPLYPALVAAVGAPISQKSRDEVKRALDDLDAAGVTPDELAIRAANYPLVMSPGIPISASAIVNNWAKIEYCPDPEPGPAEEERRDAHGFREAGAVTWARRMGFISDTPQQRDG